MSQRQKGRWGDGGRALLRGKLRWPWPQCEGTGSTLILWKLLNYCRLLRTINTASQEQEQGVFSLLHMFPKLSLKQITSNKDSLFSSGILSRYQSSKQFRILLNVAFTMFKGKSLLWQTQTLNYEKWPQGLHRRTPPWACFKCNKVSHWVKIHPSSSLSPGPCPNCGQAGHWGVDCPNLLRQGRLIPQGPHPLHSLWTFWTRLGRLMLPWVLCPQQNQDYHSRTFSDCLDNR